MDGFFFLAEGLFAPELFEYVVKAGEGEIGVLGLALKTTTSTSSHDFRSKLKPSSTFRAYHRH